MNTLDRDRARPMTALLVSAVLMAVAPFPALADAVGWESATSRAREAFERGRYEQAATAFAGAAEQAKDLAADDWRLAGSLQGQAESLLAQMRLAEAAPLLEQALARWRVAFGERSAPLAMALRATARLHVAAGRLPEAGVALDDALRMLASLDNAALLFDARLDFARWQRVARRLEAASTTLAAARETLAASGLETGAEGLLLREEAALEWAQGDRASALAASEAAVERLGGQVESGVAQLEWGIRLLASGRVERATQVLEAARSTLESRYGVEHPYALPVLLALVDAYAAQGRYAEAEPLGRRALELSERVLGPEHPDVADALTVLGAMERSRGRLELAGDYLGRAIVVLEKALGGEHPRVAAVLERSAETAAEKGDLAAAEAMWQRALAIYERSYGERHPGVPRALSGLAALERRRGRVQEAELLLTRTIGLLGAERATLVRLQIERAQMLRETGSLEAAASARDEARKALAGGETDVSLLPVQTALAAELVAAGDLDGAEAVIGGVDSLLKTESGLAPERVGEARGIRGDLLRARGRFDEASTLLRAALADLERVLGFEHPALVAAVQRVARLEQARGRNAEAELLLRRVVSLRTKLLGDDHRLVAEALRSLARQQAVLGRYSDARAQAMRALDIDVASNAGSGAERVEDHLLLASLALERGDYEETDGALTAAREAIAAAGLQGGVLEGELLSQTAALAWIHGRESEAIEDYAAAAERLAGNHGFIGLQIERADALIAAQRLADAAQVLESTRASVDSALGADHPSSVPVLNGLLRVYTAQAGFEQAESLSLHATELAERTLGATHPTFGDTLVAVGSLARAREDFLQAQASYARALEVMEKALGFEHPRVAAVLELLAETSVDAGRISEAEPQWRRALAIYERSVGEDYPGIARVLEGLGELERQRGRNADAERLLSRALSVRSALHGEDHMRTAATLAARAAVQVSSGDYAAADVAYRRALEVMERDLPAGDPRVGEALRNLAALSVLQGRLDEAHQLIERAAAVAGN